MVFENSVLRRIFGSKTEEITGGWRKLRNDERHNLYCPATTVEVIKSKRMRWVEQVVLMGRARNLYKIMDGRHEERDRQL
jgi:hypothetical protein